MTPQCCTLNRELLIFTFNCINRGFSRNNMESITNLDVAILEGLGTTRLLLHIMINYCHFFGLESPADREKRLKNCRKKDCPKYRDVCGCCKSDFIVRNTTVNKFRHTTCTQQHFPIVQTSFWSLLPCSSNMFLLAFLCF